MKFKPEDFELCKDELSQERMVQRAAHLANLRLTEMLAETERIPRHVWIDPNWWVRDLDEDNHPMFTTCPEKGAAKQWVMLVEVL